ncbi:deoxyribodipyrimidine photo-lyase [Halomonas huangheensis]|uniref:Deoxyribodipyrimidine photo-lyase n=1 Tax=Halomonas huangheensis TaxID=1178482 RepID=W1N3R7_9GAMM|nr:deoxyribodipyrimidine photo-lyase [Halomonas huangheensis]ALM51188.1 deoxyribodipyrimidine photolyase [Halomonas huangheensis]ERL49605.1 hypothetical protein BJB45_00370 [Halomonas huangheensis]
MHLSLVWFRSDLRVNDNTALSVAASRGPVVGVFLGSRTQWRQHGHGPNKISFWLRGAAALGESLAKLNIPLLYRNTEHFDDAPETLLTLARELGAEALHFNREYPLNEWHRDEAVIEYFHRSGLKAHAHRDSVAFSPGELLTGKGDFYSVFTPFSRAWSRMVDASRLEVLDAPARQQTLEISSDPPPAVLGADAPETQASIERRWPAGEEEAANRLARFLEQRARRYAEDRDYPAIQGTSELSPYLSLGMISWRQCMQAVLTINQGHLRDGDAGLTAWVNELIWREFYQHVCWGFPKVCRGRAFQQHTEGLEWRDAPNDLAAWCEGRTGYPIVDAAMRQLTTTGWMHNRLRMVVAMFLSKHLLIDWRHGEAFFMEHLIDGDFAANNGGWQWAASTGTDAAPWFRIFNPTTQSQRFDAEGHFIAEWLPELAELPPRMRHSPSTDLVTDAEYPQPIIEHKTARQRALDAFKSLTRADN